MINEENLREIISFTAKDNNDTNISDTNKDNKYDEYFQNTEKLSNNSKSINNIFLNSKIIGREYCGIDKKTKYIEIFENKKLSILGISPNITFLHIYEPKNNKKYNENKFIGFRYYDKGPNQLESKYFTLINRYDSKFFILEKNESIKDIDNEPFFDENLNCFSIINDIIIQKYKNVNHLVNGETFPEIIGYCYGLISIGKFKDFLFIEPLIPEPPFKPETLKEDIKYEKDSNITLIEPLIYNGHISLILFKWINGNRYNIIFDMSKYHTNSINLNSLIFPKDINKKNTSYPMNTIQQYSSCCLWFYGEIDCILNNKEYTSFETISKNILSSSIQFYIDTINIIGKNYFNINDLFLHEIKRTKEPKISDLNRLFINGKVDYSIDKDIVFTQFLDLNNFIKCFSFFYSSEDIKILVNTQNVIEKFINYKILLGLNQKFYEMCEKSNEICLILKDISDEIDYIKKTLLLIRTNFNVEFIKKNIFSYEIFLFDDIIKGKNITFPINDAIQKKIEELDFDSFVKEKAGELEKRQKKIETKYCIYSEEDIIKHLNPSNEICFKIMNK